MWIEEYTFHISNYKSTTLLKMELNALNRIKTTDLDNSKEINDKIKIVKEKIEEILKKSQL